MQTIRTLVTVWIFAAALLPVLNAAEPPPFHHLRFEENSAAYKEVESTTALDDLKYIPLGDSEVGS